MQFPLCEKLPCLHFWAAVARFDVKHCWHWPTLFVVAVVALAIVAVAAAVADDVGYCLLVSILAVLCLWSVAQRVSVLAAAAVVAFA